MKTIFLIFVAIATLVSCGKEKAPSDNQQLQPRPPFTQIPSHPIVAKWVSACTKLSDTEYLESGYEFRKDGSLTAARILYSNALCSAQLATYKLKGGFAMGNDVAGVADAKMFQIALSDPSVFVTFRNWDYMMGILVQLPFILGAELNVEKTVPKQAEWFNTNVTQPIEDALAGSHEFKWEGNFLYRDENIRTKKEAFTNCKVSSKTCAF